MQKITSLFWTPRAKHYIDLIFFIDLKKININHLAICKAERVLFYLFENLICFHAKAFYERQRFS